jgi:sensor histidine kinase YesM
MKHLSRRISPLLFGLLIAVSMWTITDVTYKVYFWKIDSHALLDRLYALIVVIVLIYVFYFIVDRMISHFTKENKGKMLAKEYLSVFLISIIIVTVCILFVVLIINHDKFRWLELLIGYGIAIPLNFFIYVTKRSKKITDEYNRQNLQMEKIKSNQLETELKYLQAQYHPHFLFNALNTIYFRIDDKNTDARNTVELLSELLRYQLYNADEKVNVTDEINFIKSYIQFQQLRMTKRLTINTYVDDALNNQKIYPLLYQPFLENAFKYVGGEYRIDMQLVLHGSEIFFSLENSLPDQAPQKRNGIGIENSRRRLALLYPDRHQLNIRQDEKSFMVELVINPENIEK